MERIERQETTEAPAITVPPDGGTTVWLLGDTYTLKIAGEQTGGAFALLEAVVPPGSGPPPHRHNREDETFIVLEGALEFRANGRAVPASAGTVIHVPKGTVHSYATWAGLIGLDYYALPFAKAQLAQWQERRGAPAQVPGRHAPRGAH